MKLAEMQVTEFVNLMASDAPAPGGTNGPHSPEAAGTSEFIKT